MYLVLDDWAVWAPRFLPWLEERFSPQVLDAFNDGAEPSWLEWLDNQQADLDGRREDSVGLFEKEMLANFDGVRVFHATRLANVADLKRDGLRAWTAAELRQQAEGLRGNIESPHFERCVEECNPDHRGGWVYSFASMHHALQLNDGKDGRLPSFCLEGGEFLASVRREFGGHAPEAPVEARAYLFGCDLPWHMLAANDLAYLSRTMLLDVLTSGLLEGNFSMHGDRACLPTAFDIDPQFITEFADIEHLRERQDLSPADIPWRPFSEEA